MSRPSYEDGTAILFGEATSLIGAICAVMFSILGTLGNSFTILALLQSTIRSHPTTMCLISLAISDLIFSMYNLPLLAHRFFHRGCEFMCLDWHLCKYYPFFFFGNVGVSLLIMSLIALHRLFGVFYGHLLDKVFTQVSVLLMILAAWILSFGLMYFPLTETWGQFGYEPQTFFCTIVESEGETFLPMLTVVGCGIPFLIISSSYLAIYCKVKSTGKATRKAAKERGNSGGIFGPHTMVAQTKERERSLTITFSIIFISFIICFLPLCLLTVFDPMPPSKLGWLHMIANILGWTSSFINPIIYCATNKYYLEAFTQTFHYMCRRKRYRAVPQATEETVSKDTEESLLEIKRTSIREITSFQSSGLEGVMKRIEET